MDEGGGPVVQAPYASWGTRALAALIDAVIVGGAMAIIIWMAFAGRDVAPLLFFPIFLVLGVVYKPLMEGATGQTLGKKAMKIKVVRAADGGPIGYNEAFLRWLVGALIGFVPLGTFLDILWPLWDPRLQTLHDKAAKTVVVTV
jgi:uncharacterized RDD family membrane protein YckC